MAFKSYKYRLYPSPSQELLIKKHFGCCRWVYNWALEKRIEAWRNDKGFLDRYKINAMLPSLKRAPETVWLSEVNAQSLQAETVNVEVAYKNFFKYGKAFPRFKSKKNRQRFQCPQYVSVDFECNIISFPKIGRIRAPLSRRFDGKIKTTTVSRDPSGKLYAAILVEDGRPEIPRLSFDEDSTLGIDLGLNTFATLSTGEKIENPRFLRIALYKLAREHQRLSRKDKGSRNREKQHIKVALAHEKIRNQRQDFLHKLSTRIIRENQAIALETLNVAGMIRNRSLSRSISDASWSEFVRQLEYKARWYGKTIFRIGRFEPSSRLCTCGVVNRNLTLKERIWTCPNCGATHDRDVLAANNIKRMALSQIGRDTPKSTPVESRGRKTARRSRKLLA